MEVVEEVRQARIGHHRWMGHHVIAARHRGGDRQIEEAIGVGAEVDEEVEAEEAMVAPAPTRDLAADHHGEAPRALPSVDHLLELHQGDKVGVDTEDDIHHRAETEEAEAGEARVTVRMAA